MKYVVTRSCNYYDENPVCPGAQKEMVSRYDNLVEAYTVELSSLEELDQLILEVGCPIIVYNKSNWGFDIPELEIYDGYRE